MCGIVGYIGFRECSEILLEGLRRLEYRGYDSAGIAIGVEGGEVCTVRAEGKLRNLERAYDKEGFDGVVGLGHTRWATHGRPTEENAHPHRAGRVIIAHNGIIENYAELKQELIALGHTFESATYTEVIAHLIDRELADAEAVLLDADWLESCPLLGPLQREPRFAAIRRRVRQRADSIWRVGRRNV